MNRARSARRAAVVGLGAAALLLTGGPAGALELPANPLPPVSTA